MVLGSLLALTAGACQEPDDEGEAELRQPVGSMLDAATCALGADAGSEPDAGSSPQPDAGGAQPDPSQASGLKITRVSASGAGCSTTQGNAKVALNRDGTNFVATLQSFGVGPGARLGTSSCTLVLDVEAPPGQAYAVEWIHASGHAKLSMGDFATFDSVGAFTGSAGGASTSRRVEGPQSGLVSFDSKPAAPSFSQCGRAQQVQIRASLMGKYTGTESSIRIEQIGPVRFALKPCGG